MTLGFIRVQVCLGRKPPMNQNNHFILYRPNYETIKQLTYKAEIKVKILDFVKRWSHTERVCFIAQVNE